MSDNFPETSKPRSSSVVSNKAHDLTDNWLELEFYTQTQRLKGQISCPAGIRILDLLNTPYSPTNHEKTEFIELKGYAKTDDNCLEPHTVCIKKDDILFVSAPDVNTGRGLGAKGEFKVFPFIPKEKMRVNIQLNTYSITGTLFRTKNQTIMDVLNDGMFFLPLIYALISKGNCESGNRPFIAVNKKQIIECREAYLSNTRETFDEIKRLSGIITICAWCKKIRDDEGNWHILKHYIKAQPAVEFTHSVCPECVTKHFTNLPDS